MSEKVKQEINQEQAVKELEKGYAEAEKTLKDPKKLDDFLLRLEEKLKVIPGIGKQLANVIVFVELLNDYKNKKYDKIPLGSLISIVSALGYLIFPFDLINDLIPGIGLIDDSIIIATCVKLVDSDIKEYIQWRENNN